MPVTLLDYHKELTYLFNRYTVIVKGNDRLQGDYEEQRKASSMLEDSSGLLLEHSIDDSPVVDEVSSQHNL